MATNQQYSESSDLWHLHCEWNITAAGAIVPDASGNTTSEPLFVAVRTGAGTYSLTVPGNFQKTMSAMGTYRDATPRSIVTNITAIGLGTGAPTASGGTTTVLTVVTGNTNATPAAADQAQGFVGVRVTFQKHKI